MGRAVPFCLCVAVSVFGFESEVRTNLRFHHVRQADFYKDVSTSFESRGQARIKAVIFFGLIGFPAAVCVYF